MDLQTEKIRKSKNQNDWSWRNRKGPQILLSGPI